MGAGSSSLIEELRRTEAALREQKDLSETLLRAQSELGEGVLVIEDGRIAFANEATGRLVGRSPEELRGLSSYLELIAPEQRATLDEAIRSRVVSQAPVETTLLRRDGRRSPAEVCAKTMNVGGGTRLVALMRDISMKKSVERQRLELASEQAARAAAQTEGERWALMARLGERMAEPIDFESRLHVCSRVLAPDLADVCGLFLGEGEQAPTLAAVEPAEEASVIQQAAVAATAARVIASGAAEHHAGFSAVRVRASSGRTSFLRSMIVAPLRARGRTFGALALIDTNEGRSLDARDLPFVQEVARRVGLMLDNARLHEQSQKAQAVAEAAVRERDATLLNLSKNLRLLQSVVEGTTDLVFVKDLEGRYVLVNSAFVKAFHRSLAETLGRDDAALLPPGAADLSAQHDQEVMQAGQPRTFEESVVIEGVQRTFLVTKAPYRDPKGALIGIVGIARDITQRAIDEHRLARQAVQQEAVAEIGRAALAGVPLHELFDRAVRLVAPAAGADLAHVFEVVPGDDRMLLRAGVGWPEGAVGKATVGGGSRSHAGYTLSANAPVIATDFAKEGRFQPSVLMRQSGATSGVTVPILSGTRPVGVLGAHTRQRHDFTSQDVLFLQAVANVLATAVERNRMEDALREREERLRSVVMGAPIAIFALDASGRFTLSEGRGLENLGLLPKRTIGHTVAEALPHANGLADQVKAALAGQTVTGSIEADDHAYETRLTPIRSSGGTITGVVGVATDVTESRRAERRRRVQYDVSRLLIDAESIDDANPRLIELLASRLRWDVGLVWMGSRRTGTLSCAASWTATPPSDEGLARASKATRLHGGEDIPGIVWSTGKPVWLPDAPRERSFRRSASATRDGFHTLVCLPVAGPRDVFGAIEFFSRDVRERDEDLERLLSSVAAQLGLFIERRLALLEVRRLNKELETRVVQRTHELEAANRELEAFSYSVSHDLRAPLRTIDGFSQALLEDYSNVLDEEGRHLISRVRSGTQRMALLIDDLLKLSRITRGELQRGPVDLGEVAEASIAALRQQEPERVVEIHVQPGLVVDGDAALLRVAIDNLVGNAWKFTRGRPVAKLEFGAEQRDGETVYYVRDNGAGFDMAYANKLFIPFQRLHRSTEFEGSGIGLATVQRIVQRHGGRVWAEGRVGEGATVYFTMPGPLKPEAVAPTVQPPAGA